VISDEPPKSDKLQLVADNDPAKIAERQRQLAADKARRQAAASVAALVTNLLRVLAGAGESYAVPSDLIKAAQHYLDAQNAGHRGEMPGLANLMLDRLFKSDEDERPQTEEQWRRWAADDPWRDYQEERRSLLNELRRHILREIASTITSSDLQIRRETREIDDVLRQIEDARKRYFDGPRKPANAYRRSIVEREIAKLHSTQAELQRTPDEQPNPTPRQKVADIEIENLKIQKRDEMIARLQQHQWRALYAVHSGETGAFEAVDSFTFDVLARMNLLERRPGRGKSKRDWQLTKLGAMAMSRAPGFILDPSRQV
jgi:hypothetical protein